MTLNQRDHAVKQFEHQSHIKVMVAGLKCGGVGLNLAFANKVINV
jgi:SNF2 family DNA or RNA helicase